MSVQKKSLISQRTAVKKAILATPTQSPQIAAAIRPADAQPCDQRYAQPCDQRYAQPLGPPCAQPFGPQFGQRCVPLSDPPCGRQFGRQYAQP